LQAAKSAEEMLQIYFDFSAQYFDYCVAFTLHGSSAALRHDRGIPRRSESAGIPLPLTRYPALVTTTEEKYRLLDLRDNDGSLGELIGLTGPARAFAAYVRVRARTVIALVGGVHGGNVDLSELGEVLALGPLLSQALELAIVRRKSGDSDTPMTPGLGFAARPAPVNPRARGPVLHEGKRAELLVRALGASLPPNESGRDSVTGRKREQ
jgi:hypothetical protein